MNLPNLYPLMEVASLVIVMVITAAAEMVLHYFPWPMMLNKRQLEAPWSYVVGVLAMLGPYVLLLCWWALFPPVETPVLWALAALIGVVASSGGAVIGAYWLDDYLLAKRKVQELDEQGKQLEAFAFDGQAQ